MKKQTQNDNALFVGVSSCLLGDGVRYDGGHKAHGFVTGVLSRLCALESVCPEVAAGLGVPRPPVHLVKRGPAIHALGRDDDSLDVTPALRVFSDAKVPALGHLSGYVFKSRSPSCGLDVTVLPQGRAPGLYAAAVTEAYPLLPCIEDDQLGDPLRQSNFLERMVAYCRWREFLASAPAYEDLRAFHQDNALMLMSHGRQGRDDLERLAGRTGGVGHMAPLLAAYGRGYMAHVARLAGVPEHVEVLREAVSRLPEGTDRAKIAEINDLIAGFEQGVCGLWAPLGVLRALLGMDPGSALARQTYLHPHRVEARFKVIL